MSMSSPKVSRAEEVARVTPDFPDRPTAEDIEREYTPERVLRLCRYVAARVTHSRSSREELDDAIQEASVSFYRRVKQYLGGFHIPSTYPFYHWLLFRVMTDVREVRYREKRRLNGREVYRLERQDRRWGNGEHQVRPYEPTSPEPNVDADTLMGLEDAIAKLTPRQQQIVKMYYYEHESQNEIARTLGIAQPNVAKTLKRAMARMKKAMA